MTLQEYLGEWSAIVDCSEAGRIIKKLSASSVSICPIPANIFKAFRLCPLSNLKVVILGQDPYSQKGVATGLAFANSSDTPEISYSLSLDILKESVIDFTVPHRIINFEPDLEKWEKQGVLLLNSALSCQTGRPGSHALLWRPFMKSLLTNLSSHSSGIVYVLMGTQAQSFEPYINPKHNYIIRCRHPSWYARNHLRMPSDIWHQVDSILIGLYGEKIKWFDEIY